MSYTIKDILEVLTESSQDYFFNERVCKKTRSVKRSKKEKLDRYLKTHDYHGDQKSGTITVNGNTYKVDRDIQNKKMISNGEEKPRTLSIEPDGTIHLSKEFEKIKNNKRKNALLQHEIAHDRYYNVTSDKKYSENDYDIENLKKRKENHDKFKKYEKPGTHANAEEFECDLSASQQKDGEHYKRGLREYQKHDSKENPNRLHRQHQEALKKMYDSYNEEYIQKKIKTERDRYERQLKNKSLSNDKKSEIKLKLKNLESDVRKEISDSIKKEEADLYKKYGPQRIKDDKATRYDELRRRSAVLNDRTMNRDVYKEYTLITDLLDL